MVFRVSFGSVSQVFLVSRWRQVVHDKDDIVHRIDTGSVMCGTVLYTVFTTEVLEEGGTCEMLCG